MVVIRHFSSVQVAPQLYPHFPGSSRSAKVRVWGLGDRVGGEGDSDKVIRTCFWAAQPNWHHEVSAGLPHAEIEGRIAQSEGALSSANASGERGRG
jgi:hypothetical protein